MRVEAKRERYPGWRQLHYRPLVEDQRMEPLCVSVPAPRTDGRSSPPRSALGHGRSRGTPQQAGPRQKHDRQLREQEERAAPEAANT
ncbi:hypothetical protein HYQ46_005363 [Verticillium longisporum]|nr:hypothetical protein HYQ46_005363 [Verticillium longisporum]